jgi:hypothetical protein
MRAIDPGVSPDTRTWGTRWELIVQLLYQNVQVETAGVSLF